jgi:hypothetical protein
MKLSNLLLEKKSAIVKKWLNEIYDSYPVDTSQFLKGQTDRFLNPVGYTFSQAIEGLFDEIILNDTVSEKLLLLLDNIIRIKAVQSSNPSYAVSFIFLLKQAIRTTLAKEIREQQHVEALQRTESRIDDTALLAFNIYMKCREKIHEIKVKEVKTMYFRLLKRANLITDIGDMHPAGDAEAQLTQKIEG